MRTAARPSGASDDGLLPVVGIPPRAMVLVVVPAPEPESGVGVAVGVTHGSTAVTWRAGPPAGVGVGVTVGVLVGVGVGVTVGVLVGVGVGVTVGVLVGVGVTVRVGVGVAVTMGVAVTVGVAVGVMQGSTTTGRAPAWPDTTKVNDSTTAPIKAVLAVCFFMRGSHQRK